MSFEIAHFDVTHQQMLKCAAHSIRNQQRLMEAFGSFRGMRAAHLEFAQENESIRILRVGSDSLRIVVESPLVKSQLLGIYTLGNQVACTFLCPPK